MRILIVTQAVDRRDPVLGFFHEWIKEFAGQCESIEVICLREGEHALPSSVHVHSLGKEKGSTRLQQVCRFFTYSFSLRGKYDAVFVHMNPEYVVLAGILWRVLNKPVGLWFTHKSTNWKVRTAIFFSTHIFTASEESFRIATPKVFVTGHGILPSATSFIKKYHGGELSLVTVGRISRIKNYEAMFPVLLSLQEKGLSPVLTIVGEPITQDDSVYLTELKKEIEEKKVPVIWYGAVAPNQIPELLEQSDIFLHTSGTGSLDKVILEAWVHGLYVATTSDGVRSVASRVDPELPFDETNPGRIAEKIAAFYAAPEDRQNVYRARARAYVESEHSLPVLIGRILARLKGE